MLKRRLDSAQLLAELSKRDKKSTTRITAKITVHHAEQKLISSSKPIAPPDKSESIPLNTKNLETISQPIEESTNTKLSTSADSIPEREESEPTRPSESATLAPKPIWPTKATPLMTWMVVLGGSLEAVEEQVTKADNEVVCRLPSSNDILAVTAKDLRELVDGSQICDTIVDTFLQAIRTHFDAIKPEDPPFVKMISTQAVQVFMASRSTEDIQDWEEFTTERLRKFRYVVVPVCHCQHWGTTVVDLEAGELWEIDAIGHASQFRLNLVKRFMTSMLGITRDWKLTYTAPYTQKRNDCGPLMIVTLLYKLLGKKVDFNGDDAGYFREWMACILLGADQGQGLSTGASGKDA